MVTDNGIFPRNQEDFILLCSTEWKCGCKLMIMAREMGGNQSFPY